VADSELFARDYTGARERFLQAAAGRGATLTAFANDGCRGPAGEDLLTDVACVTPAAADRVLVLVCGVHGIEGFAGSAAQVQFLDNHWSDLAPQTAVVLVHALNPYGFAHERRVNEDNVDINRNFVDHASPPENVEYDTVHAALLPQDWDGPGRRAADGALQQVALDRGQRYLQSAVTRGQYRHADGLFYGGSAPVWSNRTWRQIIRQFVVGFARVGYIDLHTGLGSRGQGEPIFRGGRDQDALARATEWYGEALTQSENGTSSSTPIGGNTAFALADELAEDTELTAITLEFGTEPGIKVLTALRADNWLHHRGQPGSPQAKEVRDLMNAAFHVDDRGWEGSVLAEAQRYISLACAGLGADNAGPLTAGE
jgi:hypothetical protein